MYRSHFRDQSSTHGTLASPHPSQSALARLTFHKPYFLVNVTGTVVEHSHLNKDCKPPNVLNQWLESKLKPQGQEVVSEKINIADIIYLETMTLS